MEYGHKNMPSGDRVKLKMYGFRIFTYLVRVLLVESYWTAQDESHNFTLRHSC